MKKFLYITDQEEYADHSFIGPLFEKYLKEYYVVDIVYFTEFKSDFEKKDEHRFIIPTRYKSTVLDELSRNNINISDYSYIVVRNTTEILQHVLKQRDAYNYKVGYRLSFPKRRAKIQNDKANNKAGLFDTLTDKLKTHNETKMINDCDIFLPTSQRMFEEFFSDVKIKMIPCPPAIDPEILHDNIQHEGEEKRFFYAGTLDKLREFETVLEAFNEIKSDKWKLTISTKDPEYAQKMVNSYDSLSSHVNIKNAKTKTELLELISQADVGVALLPNISLYNTSTPVKILDYYSSAVPSIMTNSANSNRIFTDDYDTWFCEFNKDSIKEKIEYIIDLSKEEVAQVGLKGQERLLNIRNYKTVAKKLARKLDSL